jgi:hypothetical protein
VRTLVLLTVLAASVIIARSSCDRHCLEETDEEVCESFGTQCGVTVHIVECGEDRTVECSCPSNTVCSMEGLKCE